MANTMEYLNSRLTRPVRRAIMIGWIAIFFIASPLILLYAAGYRYDVRTGSVLKTGVIDIDVDPKDAAVFLNNVRITKNRLPNRAPGSYHIRIEKPGFHTWEKDLVVESTETTYVRELQLFADALPIPAATTSTETIAQMFPSPDGEYIFFTHYKESEGNHIISLLDTATGDITVFDVPTLSTPHISWSPFGSVAYIVNSKNYEYYLELFNPKTAERITYEFAQGVGSMQWKPLDAETVIISDGEYMNAFSFSGIETLFLKPEQSRVRHIDHRNTLWFVNEDASLLVSSEDDQFLSLEKVSLPITDIVSINGDRAILQSDETVIVASRQGDLLNNVHTVKATDLQYNVWTREWNVWNDHEFYNISDAGDVFLLDRSSDPIGLVKPLDVHGLLAIEKGDQLTGFNPGYFVSHDLFGPTKLESLTANIDKREIFFLGTVGEKRGVYSLSY